MPHYIDELFELFNENPKDYFKYKKKDISCKYFWEDKTVLNAYSDKTKFINEINKVLKVDKNIVTKYLLKAKKKYDLTKSIFLEQSLHKIKTYLSSDLLKGIFTTTSTRTATTAASHRRSSSRAARTRATMDRRGATSPCADGRFRARAWTWTEG